ncbi:MAG: TadE/TadG family type IV pilus assembly protein [Phycisphaeraceae bacterium]
MNVISNGNVDAWLWSWWWQAMASPVAISCALMMVVLIAAAAVLLRTAARLSEMPTTPKRSGLADEGGTATIEFALILPVLLTVILLLVQTTLVMGGNLFVHYSAFAATRSAVVQIPKAYEHEPVNWYADARGSRKREAIHRAAAVALLPVAGPRGSATDGATLGPGVAQGLATMHRRLGEREPVWIHDRMPGRMNYALEHTEIELFRMHGSEAGSGGDWTDGGEVRAERGTTIWGPRDAVAVHVEHRLHLSVPYVNRIFADGETTWGGLTMKLGARSMLTNFGLPEQLPDAPDLPRTP